VLMDKGKDRVANEFQLKVSDLRQKYYTQWFQKKKDEETNFYYAERDRRQGYASTYTGTETYSQFKQLYDAAAELRQQMRTAVFK